MTKLFDHQTFEEVAFAEHLSLALPKLVEASLRVVAIHNKDVMP